VDIEGLTDGARSIAKSITRNDQDAKEIAQEAALRLVKMGEQARNPKAVINTIARNLALDCLRRRKRGGEVHDGSIDSQSTSVFGANVSNTNEEKIDRKKLALRVMALIPRLSPSLRVAIEKTFLEDRSISEVAKDLGMTYSAVQKNRKRGLIRLRELLAEEDDQ
jgi:RNA polymerase sigma factor (sigma-70 family)